MPPFTRPLLNHLRHPTFLSLFGFTLVPSSRSLTSAVPSSPASCTRYLIRQPSPAAIRECPTPLIFVRAVGLSPAPRVNPDQQGDTWGEWSSVFSEKGYTAVEIDVNVALPLTPNPRESPFTAMTAVLNSQIRLLAIPFPPVLVAEGRGCLLTQSYVGDHPASGLVMLDPPVDADPSGGAGDGERGWEWPRFNYEPRFPILVVVEEGKESGLRAGSRVVKAAEMGAGRGGKGVSVEVIQDGRKKQEGTRVVSVRIQVSGESSELMQEWQRVERWMDMCGF